MDRQATERLRYEIIKRACQDYCGALRQLERHTSNKKDQEARSTIYECESFFQGNWFAMLCNLDGDWMIRELRKAAKDNSRFCFKGEKEL
ncbi:MAG: hypothetical protein LIO94_07880 [Clostridiales bacterium]|nr:hypothetical protein [Clostridiales bacterium]